jgi:CheY-like chemotaxis protein
MDIESTSRPLRVLVIDDHRLSRQYTVQALRQITRRVKEAGSGREALELALRFLPRLIILDLNLPDMNGIDLLRRIRNGWPEEISPPEFVILSGDPKAGIVAQDDRSGVFRVMTKPARGRDLQELALAVLPSPRTAGEPHDMHPTATLRPKFNELFQNDLEDQGWLLDRSIAALDWRSARGVLHQMIAACAICFEADIEWHCRLLSGALAASCRPDELSRAYFGLLRAIEQSRLKAQAW